MRKTKIIATLSGYSDYERVKEMSSFFDCVRINLSHGTEAEYEKVVKYVRTIEKETGRYIPVLFDLSGPKIRVKALEDVIQVKKGDRLFFSKNGDNTKKRIISVNFSEIIDHLKEGHRVYIDDGKIRFKVTECGSLGCELLAVTDGVIKKNKGVNFPDTELPLPSLTDKDLSDISILKKLGGDYVALSFVRQKKDIEELKNILAEKGLNIPVIAKIERPEVLKRLSDIFDVADGVMVARGDLGVEVSLEKVPLYQKKIIEMGRENGKPVIVATQILETMVEKPEPTRAEVSDIANAIIDGCDALMLSGETAYGSYPVQSLSMLDTVARETERYMQRYDRDFLPSDYKFLRGDTTSAIAYAAFSAERSLKAKAIVSFTATGHTASLISKFRATCPVIAASFSEETLRRVSLYFGVKPLLIKKGENTDEMLYEIEKALLKSQFKEGDLVVITIGLPVVGKGNTNMIKVHKLGGYLPFKEINLSKKNKNV
ncbi:MAG: pyruvate kinase [bacterium]